MTATPARQRAERRFEQLRKLSHAVVFDYHDSIETLPGSTPVRRRMVKDALEKVAGRDPANAASRSDLAWSLAAEGECLAKAGEGKASAEAYGKAESIWRELKKRQAITAVDLAQADEVAAKSSLSGSERREPNPLY